MKTFQTPRPRPTRPPTPGFSRAVMVAGATLLALLLALALARTLLRPRLSTATGADSSNVELVGVGQQLYATRCAGCHADVAMLQHGGKLQHSDDQLFTIIQAGGAAVDPALSAMPAFNNLSDTEVWAIVSYLRNSEGE